MPQDFSIVFYPDLWPYRLFITNFQPSFEPGPFEEGHLGRDYLYKFQQ